MIVRAAVAGDADAIAAIYAHHVAHGTATFDFDAPDVAHWRHRLAELDARGLPFLVAKDGGRVIGYAYATQIRDRPGYRYTCEDSIYVAPEAIGRGVGSMMMAALIDACTAAGFRQMIAVIGDGEPASVALHARFGFRHAGRLTQVGRKFDRWLDTVYMQRALGED